MKNPITNTIRKAVSQDRNRHKDDETNTDLDLTYITSNIIAMGFPAVGLESAWRNHIDHVAKFLNTKHGDYFMIWNLSERGYDYDKFNNQIQEFGFPDHHPPPLDMMFKILLSMDNWLRASERNVAVVHCMGGKGRTGTVIACFLMFCGLCETPEEALRYFGSKRSAVGKGVIQSSQIRYVNYFAKILRDRWKPRAFDKKITKVYVSGVPKFSKRRPGLKPVLSVYNVATLPPKLLYISCEEEDVPFVTTEMGSMTFMPNCVVRGDLMVALRHVGNSSKKTVFELTLHTAYVDSQVTLKLDELDSIPKKQKYPDTYPDNFHVVLEFADMKRGKREARKGDVASTPPAKPTKAAKMMTPPDYQAPPSPATKKKAKSSKKKGSSHKKNRPPDHQAPSSPPKKEDESPTRAAFVLPSARFTADQQDVDDTTEDEYIGWIPKLQNCVNCSESIPVTAKACSFCGAPQKK